MFTQVQFLSQAEQHIIHNESIRILEEVGALFHSKKALGILESVSFPWPVLERGQVHS